MQVQVNTDNHIQGGEELTRQVEAVVESSLGRFRSWVTRVEVQLSDENSGAKGGSSDKRCVMEARPEGLRPVAVSHDGGTIDQALKGCAKKLARLLDDTKGRLDNPKGNTSFAGEQTL
jgi:hypothetical protein